MDPRRAGNSSGLFVGVADRYVISFFPQPVLVILVCVHGDLEYKRSRVRFGVGPVSLFHSLLL